MLSSTVKSQSSSSRQPQNWKKKFLPLSFVFFNSCFHTHHVSQKAAPEAKILVDGQPVSNDAVALHHHARVLFGSNHLYCFENPTERDAGLKAGKKWKVPTYEDAQVGG